MAQPDRADEFCSRVLDQVEERIDKMLRELAPRHAGNETTLLDVGCWDGAQTVRRGEILGAGRLLGAEVYPEPAREAVERGIEVAEVDLESESLPWADASVDVVVCNQVLEHLKNIWLPMSEMHRVLRPGGHAILSVPNLGSLHNRLLLAVGRQPTSVRVLGPHVRGYTLLEFTGLLEYRGAYRVERRRGAGFYPLPSSWSAPFSAIWPGASHTIVVQAIKQADGPMLDAYLQAPGVGWQTFYGAAEPSASE
jgi:SAM-dependent methyltransferase